MALGGRLTAGTLVELVNENSGVLVVGALLGEAAEGVYGTHTITLDNGRRFRDQGRVYAKR